MWVTDLPFGEPRGLSGKPHVWSIMSLGCCRHLNPGDLILPPHLMLSSAAGGCSGSRQHGRHHLKAIIPEVKNVSPG